MKEFIARAHAERMNAWEQAKALLDTALVDERGLSAEEQATYDAINADIDARDANIKSLMAAAEREAEMDEARQRFDGLRSAAPVAREAAAKQSDGDILRSIAAGERRGYTFSPEQRDLSKLTAGAGGNTVPTSFYNQLQEHLIVNSAIRQTNVSVLRTASGESLQVPKTTAHSTAGIITEASAITESDPTFGQVTLGSFNYALIIQVSGQLLTDTGVDLEGYLAKQAGRAIANAQGAHFVTGAGTTTPWGVVTRATSGKTGGAGVSGVFTGDDLIDLKHSVNESYRRNGASWLMSDAAVAEARKLKDATNGQYHWQPGLQAGSPDMLLGHPVFVDPNVAAPALSAKSVVFGDFSAYMIRDVAGVSVDASTDFAFNQNLVTLRFMARTDGDLVDTTGAIKFFTGNAA